MSQEPVSKGDEINKKVAARTSKVQIPECDPQWLLDIASQQIEWMKTVQYQPQKPGEPWGLFAFSTNTKIPWSIPSTVIAWGNANLCGGIEKMPGYHPNAKQEMAAFIQKFQEPKAGHFVDSLIESCPVKDLYVLREAVTKYATVFLEQLEAKSLYPYVAGGHESGRFDVGRYLQFIKSGNWNEPWAIGSGAGLQTFQVFKLINEGHTEYIPALKEGIEFILSKQNQHTGMWGPETIPLDQQIGGALKIIIRFQWYMGLIVPCMDKLADSIIRHHRSREFYAEGYCASVPRNVAEMAYACMEASDYRRNELRQILVELIKELRRYQQPDGGFAYFLSGREEQNWCGATVAEPSDTPHSDVHGFQNASGSLVQIYHWLGWTGGPWPRPPYWRESLKKLKYKVYMNDKGRVQVVHLQ